MKKTSGSGCGTVLMIFLVIGLLGACLPAIFGIAIIWGVIYAIYKLVLVKKEQSWEQKFYVETDEIENSASAIPHENSVLNSDNEIILSAGRYVGGRDLDNGIYNLFVISGSGIVKTNMPDGFYKFLSYKENNSYRNLEITQGTILMVDFGMKIKLCDKRDYITGELVRNSENENDDKSINIDNMDGHIFEQFCAGVLTKNGYQNVHVTRGSGDQGVDIIAERDGIKYAVQCKNYSQPVGNKAVQEIYTGMRFYRCHVGIVMTNNSFTPSAIELAKENGIVLWGRDYLIKFIDENNSVLNKEDKIVKKDNDFDEKTEDEKDMYDREIRNLSIGPLCCRKRYSKGKLLFNC